MQQSKEQILDFFVHIAGTQKLQIGDLRTLSNFNDCIGKPDRYICGGADKTLNQRCKNEDIKKKKYFYIDIDIRNDHFLKTGKILNQEELEEEILNCLLLLGGSKYSDYCGFVYTGNGVHIYYTGTERYIDPVIYSDGISYIMNEINEIIKQTGYVCDSACKNIARLSRMPGSINNRKKSNKQIEFDLGPIECELKYFAPIDSQCFENIELYATLYEDDSQKEKEAIREIKTTIKQTYKKDGDKRQQINSLPIDELCQKVWGVDIGNDNGEIITLKESKKNMGAYIYKPYNIVYNQGSSIIKTDRQTFTPFELVCYELLGGDTKMTCQWFKDNYNIGDDTKQTPKQELKEIVQKTYTKQGFLYPDDIFDDTFDCMMSGELLTIVAASNSGKSTFAMDMMERNINRGKKCLYINLEFGIEQVATNNWLFMNNKRKRNLTDIEPLTQEEKAKLDSYVNKYLSRFEHINRPGGMTLDELSEVLINKSNEGYELVVIDTFSMIEGNEDENAYSNQNKSIRKIQEIAQKTGLLIVQLHHTKKDGSMEGSTKILNRSNSLITLKMVHDDFLGDKYTEATLTKDKFIKCNIVNFKRENRKRILYNIQ